MKRPTFPLHYKLLIILRPARLSNRERIYIALKSHIGRYLAGLSYRFKWPIPDVATYLHRSRSPIITVYPVCHLLKDMSSHFLFIKRLPYSTILKRIYNCHSCKFHQHVVQILIK